MMSPVHSHQAERTSKRLAPVALFACCAIPAICVAQTDVSTLGGIDDLFGDASIREFSHQPGSTLSVGGVVQFRYHLVSRGDQSLSSDFTNGFQTARTIGWVEGEIGDFEYYVQGGFNQADPGDFTLNDAFLTYQVNEIVQVGAGQRRTVLMWEDAIERWDQQAIEVSSANIYLSPNRVQGVWVYAERDATRGWLMIHDGVGSANTDIDSTDEADIAITARGEYKWAGAWDQFDQFTSPVDAEEAGRVGAAIYFQTGGSTVGTRDLDALYFVFDAMYEAAGWNLFGQFAIATIDQTNQTDLLDFTLVLQGGRYFSPTLEGYARYDLIVPDDARQGDPDPAHVLAFGVNKYFNVDDPQSLKLSVDVQFVVDDPFGSQMPTSTLTGILPSADDGQISIKGQLQAKY